MESVVKFLLCFAVVVLIIRLIAVMFKSVNFKLLCSVVTCLDCFFIALFSFVFKAEINWGVGVFALVCFAIYALVALVDIDEYITKS